MHLLFNHWDFLISSFNCNFLLDHWNLKELFINLNINYGVLYFHINNLFLLSDNCFNNWNFDNSVNVLNVFHHFFNGMNYSLGNFSNLNIWNLDHLFFLNHPDCWLIDNNRILVNFGVYNFDFNDIVYFLYSFYDDIFIDYFLLVNNFVRTRSLNNSINHCLNNINLNYIDINVFVHFYNSSFLNPYFFRWTNFSYGIKVDHSFHLFFNFFDFPLNDFNFLIFLDDDLFNCSLFNNLWNLNDLNNRYFNDFFNNNLYNFLNDFFNFFDFFNNSNLSLINRNFNYFINIHNILNDLVNFNHSNNRLDHSFNGFLLNWNLNLLNSLIHLLIKYFSFYIFAHLIDSLLVNLDNILDLNKLDLRLFNNLCLNCFFDDLDGLVNIPIWFLNFFDNLNNIYLERFVIFSDFLFDHGFVNKLCSHIYHFSINFLSKRHSGHFYSFWHYWNFLFFNHLLVDFSWYTNNLFNFSVCFISQNILSEIALSSLVLCFHLLDRSSNYLFLSFDFFALILKTFLHIFSILDKIITNHVTKSINCSHNSLNFWRYLFHIFTRFVRCINFFVGELFSKHSNHFIYLKSKTQHY